MVILTRTLDNDMLTSLKGQGGRCGMTIIASVKARDGIVLATDSMSQISIRNEAGQIGIIKTYRNARKLFQVRELPIGIMSYGLGNIGARSIESLILEFSRDLETYAEKPFTVEVVSRGLYGFIKGIYDNAFQEVPIEQRREHLKLGFFISGYSPNKFLAHEWEFELPLADDIKKVRPEDKFGSSWRGVPIPFSRLYNGFDPRIRNALKQAGVADKTSPPFKVTTEEWLIDWSYTPDPEYPDFAVFGFFIYPRGETGMYVESVAVSGGDTTKGSTYSYAGAGEYYLKVHCGNVTKWKVIISSP